MSHVLAWVETRGVHVIGSCRSRIIDDYARGGKLRIVSAYAHIFNSVILASTIVVWIVAHVN